MWIQICLWQNCKSKQAVCLESKQKIYQLCFKTAGAKKSSCLTEYPAFKDSIKKKIGM